MYRRKRTKKGKQIGERAQVTLEIALSLICIFLLLFGSLKIFFWVNQRFVQRQQDYEAERVSAGSAGSESPAIQVDESAYPKLDIFGK